MSLFIETSSLYLARISPLFLAPSLLPIAKLPSTVKIILSVSIAMLLAYTIGAESYVFSMSHLDYGIKLMQEFIIGIGLVFGIQVTLAAVLFAGKTIDLQLGFGVASVLDPMTQSHEALIGSLLNSLFTVAFFSLDLHHLLVLGIANTFQSFPIGSGLALPNLTHLLSFFSGQFVLGMMVVMPVLLGLFLLDLVIAFTSRTMPQVNVYFVSLPLKIFMGLLVLSISLKYASGFIERILSNSILGWFSRFEVYL